MTIEVATGLSFIRQTLYKLKQDYGFPVDIYRVTSTGVDQSTGRRTQTRTKYPVKKAIVLPNALARKFSYDLSFIAANKNFTYGAWYDINTRICIIDSLDIPKGFQFVIDSDYLMFEGSRYEVKSAEPIEHKYGFIVVMKETVGVIQGEILIEKVSSFFEMSHLAIGVK